MLALKLRKIGGSVCLVIPKTFLESLHLTAGSKVGVTPRKNGLWVEPCQEYRLDELLDSCTPENTSMNNEDKTWLGASPIGKEVL